MFTGIVTAIGTIVEREERGDLRLRIACPWDPAKIAVGASIACAGVCLTVVERGGQAGNAWFAVDVSAETLSRTARGAWEEGAKLNLEPSLRVGDELGGHIVAGHVDGVGRIVSIRPEGGSRRVTIAAPATLGRFIAPKGSIAVDGISLTVNEVEDAGDAVRFGVNIIPHTREVTSLSDAREGTRVNIEIDTLARYVARLSEAG